MSTCSVLWTRKTKLNKKRILFLQLTGKHIKQLLPRELQYLRKVTYNSKHEFKNNWLIYGLKWFSCKLMFKLNVNSFT